MLQKESNDNDELNKLILCFNVKLWNQEKRKKGTLNTISTVASGAVFTPCLVLFGVKLTP